MTDIKEYEINVEPNKKYLQKRTNAPKYTFNSVSQFQDHDDLLKNIKNYSIKFELRTTEISVNFKFSNENNFFDTLYVNGENQTLYYGKYKLLTDYLNTKKNWYSWLYSENFIIYSPIMFLFVTLLMSLLFFESVEKILWIKTLKIFLFYTIFLVLVFNTTKVLKKYNFSFIKEKNFEKSKWYEILFTIAIGLFVNIITPYFQSFINNILKLINK
nr:MAG TPA: hypothetical protein [Caudoviricetes sp.]